MMTETGLSASPRGNRVQRHSPAVRARTWIGFRRHLAHGGLRRIAFGALTAWLLGWAAPAWAQPARGGEARPPATATRTVEPRAVARPAPVRREAQPRASGARREAQARPAARREAQSRNATRASAPRPVSPVISDGPRMRDAPQELIPVMAANQAPVSLSPRAACLAATQRAEEVHGMPRGLLTAIALAESGLHAYALSIGGRPHFPDTASEARALVEAAPPRRSIMAGCVQVNARVHARNSHWPLDPYAAADWAGGIMARWHRETGSWAEALRRWHGGSPASTQRLVCRVRAKLDVTSPGSDLFRDWNCDSTNAERVRRNGAIHLATAERQGRP
jgi:hypothetical protein